MAGGFDLGLAFDGDADRVFVVDETGRGLSGSTTTALLAAGDARPATRAPRSSTTSSARGRCPRWSASTAASRSAPRSGTRYIKQIMAETGAVFGGEHSAHYYFRDNYRADSGIIATMLVLEQLEPGRRGRCPRCASRSSATPRRGEINTEVGDPPAVLERVADAYRDAEQDRLDGLTVNCGDWWFNLRPSNTEPLLRLNLEADDREACDRRVAEVLALITEP